MQGAGSLAALAGLLGVGPGGVLTGVQQPAAVQLPAGVQLPPGVQAITLAPGVQHGAVLAGGMQQQYVLSAGGVLTAVPAGATVITGAPAAAGGYAVQVRTCQQQPAKQSLTDTAYTVLPVSCCHAAAPWDMNIHRVDEQHSIHE